MWILVRFIWFRFGSLSISNTSVGGKSFGIRLHALLKGAGPQEPIFLSLMHAPFDAELPDLAWYPMIQRGRFVWVVYRVSVTRLTGMVPSDTEGKVYVGCVSSICYQVDMVPSDTEGKVYMGRVSSICYQVGGFRGNAIL